MVGRHVDPRRIGAAGFSLGGYTVLELAGARTDMSLFRAYCVRTHWPVCAGPPEFPHQEAEMAQIAVRDPAVAAALRRSGETIIRIRASARFPQ
jgi:predicted dienelactone hydrolase